MKKDIKTTIRETITSEKPVSLYPLSFDEALRVLIKTPTPKEENQETKKPSNKS